MKKTYLTTNLFGYEIFSRDYNSLLEILNFHLKNRDKTLSIFTPNPEQIVLAKKQKSFANYLGFADLLIPDGVGLLFAAKILAFFGANKNKNGVNIKIFQRITGIDLTKDLLKIAKKDDLKVLIVGGRDYEGREYETQKVRILGLDGNGNGSNKASGATKKIVDDDLNTIWWAEGYNKIYSPTDGESKSIISTIKELKPNLVFVAFGAPNQEKWIVENIETLKSSGVSIVVAVGGTFDVLFGKVARAPKLMQNLGLEWSYRLIVEPWRWRRQLSLLEFVGLVIKEIFTLQ
ncbi:MAG: WecB/TagA/CpsF family glycosyltransferase [Candidatus Pacebacteria bacterium]|nr:WecB/TagA/CpsF family glycosyltransferase [Candidatus Paceibacterota bacterium]